MPCSLQVSTLIPSIKFTFKELVKDQSFTHTHTHTHTHSLSLSLSLTQKGGEGEGGEGEKRDRRVKDELPLETTKNNTEKIIK
jgi:hypothetical protein